MAAHPEPQDIVTAVFAVAVMDCEQLAQTYGAVVLSVDLVAFDELE